MAALTTTEIVTVHETFPQELYDKIFNLTFAYKADHRFVIDAQYKPPVQLQIDRATRKEFTNKYYGTKRRWRAKADRPVYEIFTYYDHRIVHDNELSPAELLLKTWLQALPKDAVHAVVRGASGRCGAGTRRTQFKASWDDAEPYLVRWRTYVEDNYGSGVQQEVAEIVEIVASQ